MDTDKILKSFGYTVVENIASGSYSEVILATSQRHPKTVAIKIINLEDKSSELASKFLPRELVILKKARHPHIIEVHSIFEILNKQVYIVMEPAKVDLFEKVRMDHPIPIHQVKEWFSQLLSAMDYLHQQDIVHRDLKCENVLLTEDGQIKLADFGFARFSKGFPDLSETFCGSPFYVAPEVMLFKPYDPKKSDVWSLGVILYVMLTRQFPYKGVPWREFPNLQRQPLKFPPDSTIEEPCRDLISSMLNYHPHTRPSVTQLAKHPWLQSRGGTVIGRFVVVPVREDEECRMKNAGIVIGRFVVVPVREDEECSSKPDTNPPQKDDSSSEADARCRTCGNVGVCFHRLCAAVKRGCRSLQKRMKKFFRRNSVVSDSPPRRSTTTNPEVQLNRPEVEKEPDLSQPTERHERKTQHKFHRFKKILQKTRNRIAPL